jgi:hypothetical protein
MDKINKLFTVSGLVLVICSIMINYFPANELQPKPVHAKEVKVCGQEIIQLESLSLTANTCSLESRSLQTAEDLKEHQQTDMQTKLGIAVTR